jgi:tetratricopeptide (TPR) repeat protein
MLERAPATISAFTISGDRLGLARAYNALAAAAFHTGVLEDAWKYAETALHVYDQMGHQRGVAAALTNQGNVLFEGRDDAGAARVVFRNAFDIWGKDGTDALLGIALGNLAEVEYATMEYDKSNEYAVAAIARFEAAASLSHIAWVHQTQARVAIERSHAPAAKEHLHLACDLLRRTPQPQFIARLGEVIARLLIFVGQYEEAALALAASTRLRQVRSLARMGFVAREVAGDESLVREKLGESALGDIITRVAGWDLGHLTSFFQALLVGIGRSETWRRPDIVGEPKIYH